MSSKGDVWRLLKYLNDKSIGLSYSDSGLENAKNMLDSNKEDLRCIDDPGDCPAKELEPIWQRLRDEIEKDGPFTRLTGADLEQIVTHAPSGWFPLGVLGWLRTKYKRVDCDCCGGDGEVWEQE
jgi:hypothetical protein